MPRSVTGSVNESVSSYTVSSYKSNQSPKNNSEKTPKHTSFTWKENEDTNVDATGVTTTTATEHQVLDDGTRIVKKTTELQQIHEHGATTVTNTNIERVEVVIEEDEVVYGEDLTYLDAVLFCCPCLKWCVKKKEEEEKEEKPTEGDDEKLIPQEDAMAPVEPKGVKAKAQMWEDKTKDTF